MHTCDFPLCKVVFKDNLASMQRTGEICKNSVTVKYSGQSDSMSWVGHRCDEHSQILAEHLTVEKIA